MLKATAGGGGRGIRMVASADDLTDAYERTSQEALRAFGTGVVFLERLVTGARHVEVQVIADGQGTAWALGVRDCSVQRRNQKIIEESASPVLAPGAGRGAEGVGRAAGPGRRLPRRRAPSSSSTTRGEAVRLPRGQHPAAGRAPDHRDHHRHRPGPAATARGRAAGSWTAPSRRSPGTPSRPGSTPRTRTATSRPSPGRIARLVLPAGPGIRVDTGVSEGDTIPADFDSMIAKIIAYGRDRDQALGRLRRAMAETTVIIEGGATNKSFVLDLLDQPEVIDASADTGWIDRVRAEGRLVSAPALRHRARRRGDRGVRGRGGGQPAAAAVHRARRAPAGPARDGPPAGPQAARRRLPRERGPDRASAGSASASPAAVTCTPPTSRSSGSTRTAARSPSTARASGWSSATHGPIHLVEVDGVTHRISRDEGGVVRSPAPALVVATPLAGGRRGRRRTRRSSCWRA